MSQLCIKYVRYILYKERKKTMSEKVIAIEGGYALGGGGRYNG